MSRKTKEQVLEAALQQAASYKMSPEEQEEQRISFAFGQAKLAGINITKDQVRELSALHRPDSEPHTIPFVPNGPILGYSMDQHIVDELIDITDANLTPQQREAREDDLDEEIMLGSIIEGCAEFNPATQSYEPVRELLSSRQFRLQGLRAHRLADKSWRQKLQYIRRWRSDPRDILGFMDYAKIFFNRSDWSNE